MAYPAEKDLNGCRAEKLGNEDGETQTTQMVANGAERIPIASYDTGNNGTGSYGAGEN